MKIEILYLDKFKFEFEEKLFTIYLERLVKISKNQFSQINAFKISHKKLSERLLRNRKNEIIIILDERGDNLTTHSFKDLILKSGTRDKIFIIGSTDGFDKNILKMSDRVISLSRMTFTHSFAAIILLEQIYRSVTIEVNHPYHRN